MDSPSTELSRRENNLDALRIIGALMVIVGHSYPLTGAVATIPYLYGTPIHVLGVHVFFVISGYLITKSWLRRPHLGSYLLARSLRIFPALIIVTLGSILVFGPIATSLSTSEYFGSPGTWTFLNNAILRPAFVLPGVFQGLPYGDVVNGSLWTLPVEFSCYLFVPVLMAVPARFRLVTASAFGVACAVALFTLDVPVKMYGYYLGDALEPWIFFAGGMVCAIAFTNRAFRLDLALVAALALPLVFTADAGIGRVATWMLLPYIILALGLTSTPVVRRASRYGDFSYGLYIFAFPVQQAFIAVFGVQPLSVNFVAVTAVTLLLAVVSWHLVESPSLRAKTRFERRRPPRPEPEPQTSEIAVSGDIKA
ncbi:MULTISPECIES: acyltransferase [unclassified Frigoribacterium]|uniref:acyltransferase family protein n=1 Tax=unclassified Frigoribacterium TaxID=2627005 RepID=UPI00156393C7|nr:MULTISPECIES: acyltransferase [unclassified Frigoribacterium]NQW88117.1 acyltransferase [Frigoribacterium sp. VKM Ac-2860]NQX09074.1 acyltransferase [Frigoribacterium sp. VKM Ac-2859]